MEIPRLTYDYIKATPEQQKAALELMTEEEQEAFLRCVGFMRIIVDKEYHDKIMWETMRLYLQEVKR